MSTKIWLSTQGRPCDPHDAVISVFDRGFLYGDSVYETMRTSGGVVVDLEAHLDRLGRSAEGIALEIPFARSELIAALEATLAASDNADSRVRLVVTRGVGPIALDTRVASEPLLVVIVQALEIPSTQARERGISAVIVGARESSLRPGLKTGNYLGNILALRQAHDRGADDAILCNAAGAVAEGATSNVFAVIAGQVHTPSLATGVLAGITRGVVLRLLRERLGLQVHERTIAPAQLRAADELFLTSSVRGIMPVTRLDGTTLGAGVAGPLTRRAMQAYDAYLAEVAAEGS